MTRRRLLPLALPVVALQLAAVATLVAGRDTLFLRDVLRTHLTLKAGQVEVLRQGAFPLVDLLRGGGQPLTGNPNALPFYPDTLLYLVAPPLWALNAHFWLHFLLAPWAMAWLARRWGLSRQAAWGAGTVWALSGFLLSQMSFHNLVAGVVLAPALVAATLEAAAGRRRGAPLAGACWALLLLAGDPATAGLALLLAAGAVAAAGPTPVAGEGEPGPRRGRGVGRWVLAVALGTLVAAPQLVELVRVLPASWRGFQGYSPAERALASWDPRQALEWILPFPFGRLDRLDGGRFWGHALYPGGLPFYLTLYPGALALALVAAAGVRGARGRWWAWGAVVLGAGVALGRFNPLLAPLLGLPGLGLLRFPVKAWLLVALGAATLAGFGWERALVAGERPPRRRLLATLGLLAGLYAALAAALALGLPALPLVGAPLPPPQLAAAVAARWSGLCIASALLALALVAAVSLARWRAVLGTGLLLALHAGSQLALLAPGTLARDRAAPYSVPPPIAGRIEPGTLVVHGESGRLFGQAPPAPLPAPEARWLARRAAAQLYPFVGLRRGIRYELELSPEGLDAYLSRLAADAVRRSDDGARLRLLRAWGVEALLLGRPLQAGEGARLAARQPVPGGEVLLYRLPSPPPPVRLVLGERWAADPAEAVAQLLDPAFDPAVAVVLAGAGAATRDGAGRVRLLRRGVHGIEADVAAGAAGHLVVERTWLPLYRAAVDGEAAPVRLANLHRIAVPVPAGRHRVRLWVDRRPFFAALAAAALGAAGLLAMGLRRRNARGGVY
ncbi:MAG TPA: hypothetical protein VMT16_15370 [Thermoanaerobaculia bacterium]|nr:hypothetical protein [Thermoanaerobaculia bacterium]